MSKRWGWRDWVVAVGLFCATAAVVLWQNSRLTMLWDASYLLDSSWRIALGQVPYRDFPFVHPPLTFLVQATIMRLTGRVFFHHVLYAAALGGLGTVVAWRIVLEQFRDRVAAAWGTSVLLALPLVVLGVYGIFPTPFYDCDCGFAVLVAVWLLQRIERGPGWSIAAGVAVVVPLFVKQNIGLPFLVVAVVGVGLVMLVRRSAGWVLVGAAGALAVAAAVMHWIVGIGNYVQWTVRFPAQRRIPSMADMVGIYTDETLRWTLPCVVIGLALLSLRKVWARAVGLVLVAAPMVWPMVVLVRSDESDDRASALLAIWPLVLILAGLVALWELRKGLTIERLIPIFVLAAVNGCFLSKQVWGSTYAIWPLLIVLVAGVMVVVGPTHRVEAAMNGARMHLAFAGVVAVALLVCGGFYLASEERLSYARVDEGALRYSMRPEIRGMAVRGEYLPNFEELLGFAEANIPRSDGMILMNGEDPFYFATGRTPQFPVLLFDPTTQPYSPAELRALEVAKGIRWVVVKRELQIREDPTPDKAATIAALSEGFAVERELRGYQIWRRR